MREPSRRGYDRQRAAIRHDRRTYRRRSRLSGRRRQRRRRADARRRAAESRCVSAARRRQISRHPQSRPLSERQALDRAGDARRSAERMDELGDRQSEMVGAARLRRRPRRRPRQRQVARPMRTLVARRSGRSLRRHRMGGGAALVQRQCRAARHLLFRHQSMVRRQSAAAGVKGDHSLGGICRSLSRRAVPRRHPLLCS